MKAAATVRRLEEELDEWFPFGQYLALNVRSCVEDLVEFKLTSWVAVALVFLMTGQLCAWFEFTFHVLSWGYVILSFGVLAGLVATVRTLEAHAGQEEVASLEKPIDQDNLPEDCNNSEGSDGLDLEAGSSSRGHLFASTLAAAATTTAPGVRRFPLADLHQKYRTEVWFLRVLQICLFFVCYSAARMVTSAHEWHEHPLEVLAQLFILLALHLLLGLALPTKVARFAGLMAIGEFLDDYNWHLLKVLIRLHSRGEELNAMVLANVRDAGAQLLKSPTFTQPQLRLRGATVMQLAAGLKAPREEEPMDNEPDEAGMGQDGHQRVVLGSPIMGAAVRTQLAPKADVEHWDHADEVMNTTKDVEGEAGEIGEFTPRSPGEVTGVELEAQAAALRMIPVMRSRLCCREKTCGMA